MIDREVRLKIRVHGRHPWFFRKMIDKPATPIAAGSAVRVFDRDGRAVGVGFYNSRCELALRLVTHAMVDAIEPHLCAGLAAAIDLREQTLRLPAVTNAYRLVHADGDGFPGLVLDKLGRAIVAQVASLGIHRHIEAIGEALLQRYPDHRLVLTVDDDAAKREGIVKPPQPRPRDEEIVEHGVRFLVAPGLGHKTGFFADQRDLRQRVRTIAADRRVLDLFCNTGGFAIAAALGGARRVDAADLDEAIVAQAQDNVARNRARVQVTHADAFDVLRQTGPGDYDLIVLDPPKWAMGRSEVGDAIARYRDINRLALQKLDRGGLLVTASCSGAVSEPRFLAILADAAAIAGRDARVVAVGGAGPDHPFGLECPEGRYLKTVVLHVR